MANQRNNNDNPDREVGPEAPDDTANLTSRPNYQEGSSSPIGGRPIGEFAHQGEAALANALDGGPDGTGNTGAELPDGAQSEFARTSGGQTGGMVRGISGGAIPMQSRSSGLNNEYGAQTTAAKEPLGANHQQRAKGGSVTAAGSGSAEPEPGQTGVIGSRAEEDEE